MWIGTDLIYHPGLTVFEKTYIAIFGVPINGLRNRARRILPLFKGRTFNSLLDAGCGPGIFTFELARRYPNCKVVGVDTLEEEIKNNTIVAESAGLKNCTFEVGDVTKLQYENEFDAVLCVDNLEHIDDDIAAVKNLT